jgi:hypothetical protein
MSIGINPLGGGAVDPVSNVTTSMKAKVAREPVVFVGLLNSLGLGVLSLAGVFGWWQLTEAQAGAVTALWGTVTAFAMWVVRANVTPTSMVPNPGSASTETGAPAPEVSPAADPVP